MNITNSNLVFEAHPESSSQGSGRVLGWEGIDRDERLHFVITGGSETLGIKICLPPLSVTLAR
jgi:hypothetical protein